MSLRARVLVGMALIGAVLVAAAIIITRNTESHLVAQVDEQLSAAAEGARHDLEGDKRPGPGGPGRSFLSNFYVASVSANGQLDAATVPNYGGTEVAAPRVPAADLRNVERGEVRRLTVGSDGSDLRYRLLAFSDPEYNVVVVGRPIDDVDSAVQRLIEVEVLVTLLIVLVLALVTYWVIRHGVRPIKQMTATATAIAGGDLSHRVPDVVHGTEAGELGTALNQMLTRIEAAFAERAESEDRLRRFVADASHELRTPVTTIRGYAELYRSGALDETGELREAMRRTEQEAVRMGSLIEDLLLLARLDEGRPIERAPVDLGVLAEDAVRDARAVDPQRPITATIREPVTVIGDDGRLRQVLANLVRNALVHTPSGTLVDVTVGRDNGRAFLEVRDEGPGMAPDVAAKAFERFYRADPSRSRSRGGTGLGLAIVDATVHAHGGAVGIRTAPGEGTTVRVELPVTP